MKRSLVVLLFVVVFAVACTSNKNKSAVTAKSEKSSTTEMVNSVVKKYTYQELEPLLNKKNDSIYVINFWATWCKPCVKELPAFDQLQQEYAHKNVVVLLVSLDFPKLIDTKVKPFIQKRNIKSKVVLLDEGKKDFWIKAISEKWSGAIPATLIYHKENKRFYEQTFSYQTLEAELQTFLN